jgi:uncharacterized protein (TIGR02246 family)
MKHTLCLLTAGGALAVLVPMLTTQPRSVGQTKSTEPAKTAEPAKALPAKASAEAADPKHAEDDAAIRKGAEAFLKAFEKGDAKAVAAFWTEEGEYISDDGTTVRGRAAIEAAYAKSFAKKKNVKLNITIESIRFPSKDTAIEEGYAKLYKGDSDMPTSSRYSVLHVRDGGKWLMAVLREWPDHGVTLRDLDWLIGTWEGKNDEAEVRTVFTWDAKKNSIRCQITIKAKERTVNATQFIMQDPRDGQIRSWTFDDEGGFGDAVWTRDGKKWVIMADGVEGDGDEVSATNIMVQVDKDTFTWHSTERTLNDEDLPDIAPVKVKRVK